MAPEYIEKMCLHEGKVPANLIKENELKRVMKKNMSKMVNILVKEIEKGGAR